MAKNLSDYWRVDSSRDRVSELASILDGATRVVELLGGRYGVQWVGQFVVSYSKKLIGLDGGILNGFKTPIPGRVVDVVLGMAIHEAGHERWTEPTSNYQDWHKLSNDEKHELSNIHNILESAYIDSRLGRISNTLSEYIRAARRVMHPEWGRQATKLLAGDFARDNLVEVWAALSLYGENVSDKASPKVMEALVPLIQKTADYVKVVDSRKRLDMAVDNWKWLQQFPTKSVGSAIGQAKLEMESRIPRSENSYDDEIAEQLRRNIYGSNFPGSLQDLCNYMDNSTKTDASRDTNEKMGDYAGGHVEDLTQQLSQMGIRASVTKIKDGFYDPLSYNKVKNMVSKEIQQVHHIFSQLDVLGAKWRHGLKNGKLDGRRLSKAGVGKTTVFKIRDIRNKSSLAVVLLMDVSASMNPYLGDVNKTACIFAEALQPLSPKIWYEVVTYTGKGLHSGSDVQLSRLASSKMKLSLESIWTGGGTPSGEAIAAALLLLKRRSAHRKMVIHFTDGCPKDTFTVRQALRQCQKGGVDIITISVEVNQSDLYGQGKVVVINSVSELPDGIMGMLKRIYRTSL